MRDELQEAEGSFYRWKREAEELARRIEASDDPQTDEVKEKLDDLLAVIKSLGEVAKKDLG